MDAEQFDALTRTLVGRRLVLAASAAFVADLVRRDPAAAKQRKPNRKQKRRRQREKEKQPNCTAGERLCDGRCIAAEACCTDTECRPLGDCASCYDGECLASSGKCDETYGPCYACNTVTFKCEAAPFLNGEPCGSCRFCRDGNCVDCEALGECAGCQNGECVHSDSKCVEAYGRPCVSCNALFNCTLDGDPCDQGSVSICCPPERPCCNGVCCDGVCCGPDREHGNCYTEPGYICCSDDPGSGCPDFDHCCGGECVDFDRTDEHCGSCYHACRPDQMCVDGRCECRYAGRPKECESAQQCIPETSECCGSIWCDSPLVCCGSGDTADCGRPPC